jgi:uncharacterized membrane protein YccC
MRSGRTSLGARRLVDASVRRVRERGKAAFARVLRLTGAAVVSYLVALEIGADPRPVTAALTALLIVQVTLVGTVADTFRRILSVLLGVGVAIAFSSFVGFTWWSLGAVIAGSILLGQALRLGPHLMEVPISAMLILAAGGAGVQAVDRVIETLVGAAVGLLVNVIFPPSVQTRTAGAAVEQFAESIARLLDRVARSLGDREPDADEVRSWLHESRRITNDIGHVERVLAEAGESRRLNPRAAGTTDSTPDLRSGLESLEHSAVALRAVFRSIADGVASESGGALHGLGNEDLRGAFAALMTDLARAVRGFGSLVRTEIDHDDGPHTTELAEALDSVREARALLTELLLVDPHDAPDAWQLNGSLLAGVDRVLIELDVEERMRRIRRRRVEAAELRGPAAQAAERLRSTTRRVVTESPTLRRRGRRDR